jgi:hypothetical protein
VLDPDRRVNFSLSQRERASGGHNHAPVLATLLSDADPAVVQSALFGAIVKSRRSPLPKLEAWVREGKGEFADAALFLALTGGPPALGLLRDRALASPACALGLGWLGHVQGVPVLLNCLREGKPAIRTAALEALQRLTGGSLRKGQPEPTYPKDALPFTPRHPTPEPLTDLDPNPAVWSAWWKRYGEAAQPKLRYRWGHPWTPEDSFRELEAPDSPNSLRRWSLVELAATTGLEATIDLEQFVVVQQRSLSALRSAVAACQARLKPGSWPS